MHIVSRRTMLALPVERLVGNSHNNHHHHHSSSRSRLSLSPDSVTSDSSSISGESSDSPTRTLNTNSGSSQGCPNNGHGQGESDKMTVPMSPQQGSPSRESYSPPANRKMHYVLISGQSSSSKASKLVISSSPSSPGSVSNEPNNDDDDDKNPEGVFDQAPIETKKTNTKEPYYRHNLQLEPNRTRSRSPKPNNKNIKNPERTCCNSPAGNSVGETMRNSTSNNSRGTVVKSEVDTDDRFPKEPSTTASALLEPRDRKLIDHPDPPSSCNNKPRSDKFNEEMSANPNNNTNLTEEEEEPEVRVDDDDDDGDMDDEDDAPNNRVTTMSSKVNNNSSTSGPRSSNSSPSERPKDHNHHYRLNQGHRSNNPDDNNERTEGAHNSSIDSNNDEDPHYQYHNHHHYNHHVGGNHFPHNNSSDNNPGRPPSRPSSSTSSASSISNSFHKKQHQVPKINCSNPHFLKFSIDSILRPDFGTTTTTANPANNKHLSTARINGQVFNPFFNITSSESRFHLNNPQKWASNPLPSPNFIAKTELPSPSPSTSSVLSLQTKRRREGSVSSADGHRPYRPSSVNCHSEDSNSSSISRLREEVVDDTKVNPPVPKGPLVWPAWVYCTRYSDRPSSGPRSRRIRKNPTDIPEEKRPRTAFTGEQLARLKQEFDENRYLTEKRRQDLARDLKLHENQIKIWFQNKRAKLKKSTGTKNGLAQQLMAQGLYNHSTVPIDEDDEMEMEMGSAMSMGMGMHMMQ